MPNWTTVLLAALLLAGADAGAHAQTYPSTTVKLIVPVPAGGVTDTMARIVAQRLTEAWGQPVVVDNRPGGNYAVGAQAVAKSPPDGLTLLMAASGEVAINQHLYKDKMSYDPLREFAPVALVGMVPCVVVVAANTPVRTAAELIAYARSHRGKRSFSSSGI